VFLITTIISSNTASSSQPGKYIIDFEHAVGSLMHAATTVRRLGSLVIPFHIQAQPAHETLLLREVLCLSKKGTKDSAASKLRCCVYTLNPPEHAIAPVGPLVGDHHLANARPADFRNQIKAAPRIIENRMNTTSQTIDIQGKIFGFERQLRVAANQELRVVNRGAADSDFSKASHRSHESCNTTEAHEFGDRPSLSCSLINGTRCSGLGRIIRIIGKLSSDA